MDDPLSGSADDDLGRAPYAQHAADRIISTQTFDSSIVFGLTGPWGSGKTSLINMIVEKIEATDDRWKIARFTPWAASDVSGLLEEFYAALSDALPKRKAEKARRALAVAAEVAAPAAQLVPFAGASAESAVRAGAERLSQAKPWRRAFEEASARLAKLEIPILVVVDDIDRLHRDELMTLLKVIRLLGRFPGVQYLLAYDDDTLYRNLDVDLGVRERDGSAERYLEKIVQYPLLVPPMLQQQQLARLNIGFRAMRPDSEDQPLRRIANLLPCFLFMLRTPRAIDRYTAQVRHHLPMWNPDEIDDEDVSLLTLLRVSSPALFNQIPLFKAELISGHTREIKRPIASGIEYEPFDQTILTNLAPSAIRGEARRVLYSLFPKIQDGSSLARSASTTGRGVCVEEYFDRYFAMSIPTHDVSNAEIHTAAAQAQAGSPAALLDLVGSSDRDRALLVMAKVGDAVYNPTNDMQRLQFARALIAAAQQLGDDSQAISPSDRALGIASVQLASLAPDTPAQHVTAVIDELTMVHHRIRLLEQVQYANERRPTPPSWFAQANRHVAEAVLNSVESNLRLGDKAPTDESLMYELKYLLDADIRDDSINRVQTLISTGTVTLEAFASRLVKARTFLGLGADDWHLYDVDQPLFDQFAPSDDDPWYAEPVIETDPRDLSWAGRRRYAHGRFRRPTDADAGIIDPGAA